MPSISEYLINETEKLEKELRKAIVDRRITHKAADALLNEEIKMLVSLQMRSIVMNDHQPPKDDPRIVVPKPLAVVPNA